MTACSGLALLEGVSFKLSYNNRLRERTVSNMIREFKVVIIYTEARPKTNQLLRLLKIIRAWSTVYIMTTIAS